jgi:excisionase family DNA binding protein
MARLLTMPEVMQYLRLSRAAVHRLVRAGRLPVVRIGGRVLFRKETLDAFISNAECRRGRTMPASAETPAETKPLVYAGVPE